MPSVLALPALASPPREPSYVEEHSQRVARALLHFDQSERMAAPIDAMRERDRLRLYGVTPGSPGANGFGAALFSATIVAAAHAPRPLRRIFDGRLHIGPAILDGGATGAGAGARF
jgi:hypothetical protein